MGTRSITQVKVNNEPILTIYRQMDGYLDGHGKELIPLLKRKHVNGYYSQFAQYNGPSNFAAMLIAELMLNHSVATIRMLENFNPNESDAENKPLQLACGSIYITEHSEIGKEEFNYVINFTKSNEPKEPTIDVSSYGKSIKGMTVQEFEELCENGLPEECN